MLAARDALGHGAARQVGGGVPGHAHVAVRQHPPGQRLVQPARGQPDDISLGHGRSARSGWARRLPASAKTTWHPTEYAPTADQHLQPTAPDLSKGVNRAKLISLVRHGCGFHAYLLA